MKNLVKPEIILVVAAGAISIAQGILGKKSEDTARLKMKEEITKEVLESLNK